MRFLFCFFLALSALLFSTIGLAEIDLSKEVTPDFLEYLLKSLGGIHGASALGAAGIVVQILIKALDQPFANRFFSGMNGFGKIALVSALTFTAAPLGLMAGAGLTFSAAMVHSSTLAAFMVFINQLYKQAKETVKNE